MTDRAISKIHLDTVINKVTANGITITHMLTVIQFDNGDIDIFIQKDTEGNKSHTLKWDTLASINLAELK